MCEIDLIIGDDLWIVKFKFWAETIRRLVFDFGGTILYAPGPRAVVEGQDQ